MSVLLAKGNQMIRCFMAAGAYDAATAKSISAVNIPAWKINNRTVNILEWKGILVRSERDLYYLNQSRLAIRQRYVKKVFAAVMGAAVLLIIASALIS